MALGNFYESDEFEKVDLDTAAEYYKIAAEMNKPYALYKTGRFSEKGIHQYSSEREARENILKFYEAAMKLGSVEATLRLAQIYEKGELGVEVSKDEALRLYRVVDHDEEAMNSIGSILYEKKQYKRAAELFRKSAEKGNPTGLNNLGT
jgi:TPR repeat protein